MPTVSQLRQEIELKFKNLDNTKLSNDNILKLIKLREEVNRLSGTVIGWDTIENIDNYSIPPEEAERIKNSFMHFFEGKA